MARVLLFGRLADIAGWRERSLDPSPATIFALRALLSAEDAALGEALEARGVQVALEKAIVRGDAALGPGVQAAVDKVVVRGDAPLAALTEVAFLPPMSGG